MPIDWDRRFDQMPLPTELLKRGWVSVGRMRYEHGAVTILFDTSSQFEIFRNGERLGDFYAAATADFISVLEASVPDAK